MENKIKFATIELVDYLWDDELTNFEESFDIEVDENNLDELIVECQEDENMRNHIFYNLMILKQKYSK
jgi:hypothetical protein